MTTIPEIFSKIESRFDASNWEGTNAVFQFKIADDSWVAKVNDGKIDVKQDSVDNADMTMTCSSEDFIALTTGELNAVNAFMGGKIKIDGNMSLAMKLQDLI